MRRLSMFGAMLALGLLANLAPSSGRFAAPATGDAFGITRGWGHEAIDRVAEAAASFPLISVANACGLGNSSCARCHDGRRAAAPPSAAATAPWHRDHARVNNSCVGCHQGNPRVMRQDVAHQKLIAAPLKDTDRHCRTCHKGSAGDALIQRYLPLPSSTP